MAEIADMRAPATPSVFEREDRTRALEAACRHRLASESAADVVKNAALYFEFLAGRPPLREVKSLELQP